MINIKFSKDEIHNLIDALEVYYHEMNFTDEEDWDCDLEKESALSDIDNLEYKISKFDPNSKHYYNHLFRFSIYRK